MGPLHYAITQRVRVSLDIPKQTAFKLSYSSTLLLHVLVFSHISNARL